MLLALLAGAAMLPTAANATREDAAELSAYARARAADSVGASGQAAQGYAAALALNPNNEVLAARALSQAMAAGDQPLALMAARILQRSGKLAPDARLLLLTEALRTRDWKAANAQIDQIQSDQIFAFMTPVLRAWTAYGSRRGKPLEILAAAQADPLAGAYAAEHRPLMLLALGDEKQGVTELLALTGNAGGGRADRLRIAGAALLARKGDREEALSLLQGDAPALVAARKRIEARQRIPGEIASAPAGVAEFLVRVAVDLHRQNVTPLALSYARLATFLAPENSETWLVTSELLTASDQPKDALAVLANIAPDDPYAVGVADSRIRLLTATGDKQAALAEAEGATRRAGASAEDWARLGELYAELDRPKEAAAAYGNAIAAAQAAGEPPQWTLHLLHGSSLHEAKQWPEAKAALEQAYKLAPDQPLVLNYLGYSQLERRENLAEAEKLIKEASRLKPDDAAITDSLGWTHFIRGNLPEAIRLLERAVEGQPADPAINEHLGDAYYTAGRRYEARYAWEAALLNAEADAAERLRAKIQTGLTAKTASP